MSLLFHILIPSFETSKNVSVFGSIILESKICDISFVGSSPIACNFPFSYRYFPPSLTVIGFAGAGAGAGAASGSFAIILFCGLAFFFVD